MDVMGANRSSEETPPGFSIGAFIGYGGSFGLVQLVVHWLFGAFGHPIQKSTLEMSLSSLLFGLGMATLWWFVKRIRWRRARKS